MNFDAVVAKGTEFLNKVLFNQNKPTLKDNFANIPAQQDPSPLPSQKPPVILQSAPLIPQQAMNASVDSLLKNKLDNPKLKLTPNESISLLSHCITLGLKQAEKAVDKDLIIVIGNTGSGKSTYVNFLYGCEMELKSPKELGISGLIEKIVTIKPDSPIKEIMPIGHNTKKSMTFMPQIEVDKQGRSFCDCPGFLDNRGFEINIANAVNIKNAFVKAKSIKVVMLINYYSLRVDRARGLTEMIKMTSDLFGSKENLIKYKESILLGITQIPAASAGEERDDLDDLKNWLKESDFTDSFEKNTLEHLAEQLFIYDPLNRELKYKNGWSRQTILRSLDNLSPIDHSGGIFQTVLTPEDQQGLLKISDELRDRIQKTLNQQTLSYQDFIEVAKYQQCLHQLEIIDHPYVIKLIAEVKSEIIKYFNKMVNRFNVCCADSSQKLLQESKTILSEIKQNIQIFDDAVKNQVNISELEGRFQLLLKKQEAGKAKTELNDLAKGFFEFCNGKNFVQASQRLKSMSDKVKTFDNEFAHTGIKYEIDLGSLQKFYDKAKYNYDESIKKAAEQAQEMQRLKQENDKIKREQKKIKEGIAIDKFTTETKRIADALNIAEEKERLLTSEKTKWDAELEQICKQEDELQQEMYKVLTEASLRDQNRCVMWKELMADDSWYGSDLIAQGKKIEQSMAKVLETKKTLSFTIEEMRKKTYQIGLELGRLRAEKLMPAVVLKKELDAITEF